MGVSAPAVLHLRSNLKWSAALARHRLIRWRRGGDLMLILPPPLPPHLFVSEWESTRSHQKNIFIHLNLTIWPYKHKQNKTAFRLPPPLTFRLRFRLSLTIHYNRKLYQLFIKQERRKQTRILDASKRIPNAIQRNRWSNATWRRRQHRQQRQQQRVRTTQQSSPFPPLDPPPPPAPPPPLGEVTAINVLVCSNNVTTAELLHRCGSPWWISSTGFASGFLSGIFCCRCCCCPGFASRIDDPGSRIQPLHLHSLTPPPDRRKGLRAVRWNDFKWKCSVITSGIYRNPDPTCGYSAILSKKLKKKRCFKTWKHFFGLAKVCWN